MSRLGESGLWLSVLTEDRHVSIECYSQRLWSRLAASEAIQDHLTQGP